MNTIATSETICKTNLVDDVLLQDPDAGTQELTLSSFSFTGELQTSLIAHLVEGPVSILEVAAKVLEHKVFDSWGHKKIAEIVLEHFRKWGERPAKKMLASLLRQAGAARKDIEAHISSLEALKYEPLESVGYWTDTIVSVSQRYRIATAQKKLTEDGNLSQFYEAVSAARQLDGKLQEYSLMSPDELLELEDLEWQIAGHFPTKGTVTVFGASGAGKSFYCLDQALCIASGTPFLGQHEAKAGKVLYLCSEGSYGLKGRVKAWQEGNKVKHLENIVFSTVCHNLQDRGEIDQLISKAVAKLGGIDAVFVDTLSRNFGSGDTDKNADMQTYLRNIDYIREKTGAMILQNGGKFNPLVINHDQMQFLQSREFDLRLISLIFQLPPHFLASAINSSYGSIEVETLNALSRMNYWLLQLEDELSEKLLTERQKESNSHFIEFNREQAVQMDAMTKINALVTQRNNGLLTTNQAKAKLNEQPLGPEGDVTYIPGNLVPIDQPDGRQHVQDSSSPTELQAQLDATAGQGGPQETGATGTAPRADVQGTALNGAQIASLLTIVQSVADGLLPQETAAGVIKASFPTLNDAQVAAMLKPLETFQPEQPEPQQPEPQPPQDGGEQDGITQPQPDANN